MRLFWVKKSRLLAVLVASLTLFLAGCSPYLPQDMLSPNSPAAQETADLFYFIFWIAVVVFILVEGLLVYFVLRYQRRAQDEHPEQYHGNTPGNYVDPHPGINSSRGVWAYDSNDGLDRPDTGSFRRPPNYSGGTSMVVGNSVR